MQPLLRRAEQRLLPAESLAAIVELRRRLDALEAEDVRMLRAAGVSWADIARPLGISRQAAQKKFQD